MGTPRERPDMLPVEMVEVDDLETPDEPHQAAPAGAGTSRRRAVGVGVLVVLVVTGLVGLLSGRHQEDDGLLGAGVPDLSAPPEVRWSVVTAGRSTVVDDLVVSVRRTDHGFAVSALEVTTGEERWVHGIGGDGVAGVRCTVQVDLRDGRALVCELRHRDRPRLVLLDASSGRPLPGAEPELSPDHAGLRALAGDLVTLAYAPDATVVERHDVGGRGTGWVRRLPLSADRSGRLRHVEVVGDRVIVTGPEHAVLDGRDGSVVGRWPADPSPQRDVAADVVVAPHGTAVHPRGDAPLTPTLWYAADAPGQGPVELPGVPAEPRLSDGSVPEVVLTEVDGRYLQGWRAVSNVPRWSLTLGDEEPVLRSAGRVVLAGADGVRAIDLWSGREVWRNGADGVRTAHAVSDGRAVLVSGVVRGAGPSFGAVSLVDGSLLWRVPMPDGATRVEVHGGRLLAMGPRLAVGLG